MRDVELGHTLDMDAHLIKARCCVPKISFNDDERYGKVQARMHAES